MPRQINASTSVYKQSQNDVFADGRDDSTIEAAGGIVTASLAEGQIQPTVAVDGDLRQIDTDAEALGLNPTDNVNGSASEAYSITYMFRWLIKLLQGVSSKIPALSGGKIPVEAGTVTANLGTISNVATQETLVIVAQLLAGTLAVNGSGHTQPISASSLPLPTGAASEATLGAIETALSGPITVDAASLPLPTGAASEVTLATRASESTLGQVRDRLRVSAFSIGATSTASTGAQWVALEAGAASAITLRNRSGVSIEARKAGGSGNSILIASSEDVALPVISNSNEWEIRRADISNTQVSLKFLRYTA